MIKLCGSIAITDILFGNFAGQLNFGYQVLQININFGDVRTSFMIDVSMGVCIGFPYSTSNGLKP